MAAPSIDQERDERLARLLADLGEQKRQGQVPDLEAACSRHTDLSSELRQLWAAAQFADVFARSSQSTAPRNAPSSAPLAALLPRDFGDYHLLEELGRGGMGVVYKAKQKSLGRTVALKMILRGDLATSADLARFHGEAQAAAHLDHPNIVAVYDAGEVGGQAYFTMRHVEGPTLATAMSGVPLPPREAARLLAAIGRGVDFAHKRGVLHRDLKPSNIMLSMSARADGAEIPPLSVRLKDAVPLVTDFGLAKRATRNGQRDWGLDAHWRGCRHAGLYGARTGQRQSR